MKNEFIVTGLGIKNIFGDEVNNQWPCEIELDENKKYRFQYVNCTDMPDWLNGLELRLRSRFPRTMNKLFGKLHFTNTRVS